MRELGLEPVPGQEDSAFIIDFAILDERTGMFGIGIECDAPRHAILARARAREIWRPAVLRRSLPRIHRVSSFGWYHERQAEKDRLKRAVEEALGRSIASPRNQL